MRSATALVIGLGAVLGAVAWSGAAADGFPALNDTIAGDVVRIAPPLVTREQWKARPALPGMKPQTPAAIILHHTAVASNPKYPLEAKLRNLQSFSQRA